MERYIKASLSKVLCVFVLFPVVSGCGSAEATRSRDAAAEGTRAASREEHAFTDTDMSVDANRFPLKGAWVSKEMVIRHAPVRGNLEDAYFVRNGIRYHWRGGVMGQSSTTALPNLLDWIPYPVRPQSGFWFYSPYCLFRSDTFIGDLTALFCADTEISKVETGPSFLLVQAASGSSLIDPSTGEKIDSPVPRMVNVASQGTLAAAVNGLGELWVTTDGHSWKRVREKETLSVEAKGDEIRVSVTSGEVFRLTSKGELLALRVEPEPSPQPEEPQRSSASSGPYCSLLGPPKIDTAFSPLGGIMLDGGRGLRVNEGRLVEMDMVHLRVLSESEAWIPGSSRCELHHQGEAVVAVCRTNTGRVSLWKLDSGKLIYERSFPRETRTILGERELIIEASCDEVTKSDSSPDNGSTSDETVVVEEGIASDDGVMPTQEKICIRTDSGQYEDLDVSGLLKPGAALPNAPLAVDWTPIRGGGAAALVWLSEDLYLLDGIHRQVRLFAKNFPVSRRNELLGQGRSMVSTSRRIDMTSGTVEGYSDFTSFKLSASGLTSPPFVFQQLVSYRSRAAATDTEHRFFESGDFGATWSEAQAAPPEALLGVINFSGECAELGCAFGDWMRLGWGADAPGFQAKRLLAHALASPHRGGDAKLQCRQAVVPTMKEIPDPSDGEETHFACGLGAQKMRVEQGNDYFEHFMYFDSLLPERSYPATARFLDNSNSFEDTAGSSRPYRGSLDLWAALPFDPEGKVVHRTVSQKSLGRILGPDEDLNMELFGDIVLPIATPPGKPLDNLLFHNTRLLIPFRGVSALNPDDDAEIIAAATDLEGDLCVLERAADSLKNNLLCFSKKTARSVLKVTGKPQAAAVDVDGKVGMIFAPTDGEAPSKKEPLLWQRTSTDAPSALAPWDLLMPGNDERCRISKSDVRFVLSGTLKWLPISIEMFDGMPVKFESRVQFVLRGDEQRLCLDAVSYPIYSKIQGEETSATATVRFIGSDKIEAGIVSVDECFEYRGPLECTWVR